MAKVSSLFIAPVHGVSQQDPTLVPEGYLKEQVNMISDAIKGLYRRPGTELLKLYTKYPKVFIKVIEHNQIDYEIFLARDSVDPQWYLKITKLDTQEPIVDKTITSSDLVAYLDTLEDDNDLLLRDYQNTLYLVSRNKNIQITQESAIVTITFKGTEAFIYGLPGFFDVTIGETGGQVEHFQIYADFFGVSSYTEIVMEAYAADFNNKLSAYLASSMTMDYSNYKMTLTFKDNVGVDIKYNTILATSFQSFEAMNTTGLNPLHYESSSAYWRIDFNNTIGNQHLKFYYVANNISADLTIDCSLYTSYTDICPMIESDMHAKTGITVNAYMYNSETIVIRVPAKFLVLQTVDYNSVPNAIEIRCVDETEEPLIVWLTPASYTGKPIGWYPKRKGIIKFNAPTKTDIYNNPGIYIPKITFNVHKFGETGTDHIFIKNRLGGFFSMTSILNTMDVEVDEYATSLGLPSGTLEATVGTNSLNIYVRHEYEFKVEDDFPPPVGIASIENTSLNISLGSDAYPIMYNWVSSELSRFNLQLLSASADTFFILSYLSDSPIVDLMFYQNRLVFITERALLASRTGRFSQFYPDNPDIMLESDPILLLIAQAGDKLQAMIPFSESILLIGNREQYALYHQGFMTFANLTLLPATSYTLGIARPTKAGSEVFFSNNNQQYSRVLKYIVQPNTQIKTAYELTMNIPKYIPKDISKLIYLGSLDILVAFTKESPSTLYVLQQAYQGDQQVQLAWHKWTFEYPIVNIEKDSKDLLYIMFDLGDTIGVSKMDLISKKPKFYLDLWEIQSISFSNPNRLYVLKDLEGNYLEGTSDNFTYTGVPFESYIELQPWILRNSQGQPVTDGRLQLRQLELIFTDTWYLKVVNTPMGRPEYYREYQNLTLDGYEIPGGYNQDILDYISESRGVLKTYIGGQANKTNLKITSGDSMWRMGILGYTLFGNWQQFSKWSHGTSMGNGGV